MVDACSFVRGDREYLCGVCYFEEVLVSTMVSVVLKVNQVKLEDEDQDKEKEEDTYYCIESH